MDKPTKPSTIEELKKALSHYHVSDEDLETLQEHFEDEDFDMPGIIEDVKDADEAMLIDFCRENLTDGERVFELIKALVEGDTDNLPSPTPNPPNDKPDTPPPPPDKPKTPVTTKQQDVEFKEEKKDSETQWKHNTKKENADGTVILNAGLIMIPDEVICDPQYLENIRGITYVLKYNNCIIQEPRPPRLPYSYVQFWENYLTDEPPTYASIASDIDKNEGPTYDYLMENPPFDRILPVLEKVVDQLKHPVLDSAPPKEKRGNKDPYKENIIDLFETQTPDYKPSKDVISTCVLFKKNTNDTNFNTFELFINFIDIYDRILYDKKRWKNVTTPDDITGPFVDKLTKDDHAALNASLVDIHCDNLYPQLKSPSQLINDDLCAFQCISLSFVLFVKSFMSETGNGLERGKHLYKSRTRKQTRDEKARKVPPVVIPFTANIKSLRENKYERALIRARPKHIDYASIEVDDDDIEFHNENMPLQFDLVILPKDHELNHKWSDKYESIGIESESYKTPQTRDDIYALYGQIVTAFRRVLGNKKNQIEASPQEKDKKRSKQNRRDDRYCVVFDRSRDVFYIYPPHIANGSGKIIHNRDACGKRQTEEEKVHDKVHDKVDNKFSYIAHEYNDLSNLYLTCKCLIPAAAGKYYGICKDVPFVFSAHFHKQRQWHRHPKLRMYQYFAGGGGGLRFFYSHKHSNVYQWDKDILTLWPHYFEGNQQGIDDQFIQQCAIFDKVFDLYKCDMQYFRWDNAIKRALAKNK